MIGYSAVRRTWNTAHVHLQHAVRRVREQADRHRRPGPPYARGQWVWLSTRDLRLRLRAKSSVPGTWVHLNNSSNYTCFISFSTSCQLPYLTHFPYFFAQARRWSERGGGPGGDR